MREKSDNLPELTPHQVDVLELLTQGSSLEEIASELAIGERSVGRTIRSIADKFAFFDERLKRNTKTIGRVARITSLYTKLYQDRSESEIKAFSFQLAPDVHRLYVRHTQDIKEDKIQTNTKVEIECLYERVEYVSHGLILEDRTSKVDASNQSIEAWSLTSGVEATATTTVQNKTSPSIRISFDPPLKRGQGVTYEYQVITANYYPMTIQAIKERLAEGDGSNKRYNLDEIASEKNFTISHPTGHLFLELIFPERYEIDKHHIIVEAGHNGPIDKDEQSRIEKANAFRKDVYQRRVRLILDLSKPPLHHRYRIRWIPTK